MEHLEDGAPALPAILNFELPTQPASQNSTPPSSDESCYRFKLATPSQSSLPSSNSSPKSTCEEAQAQEEETGEFRPSVDEGHDEEDDFEIFVPELDYNAVDKPFNWRLGHFLEGRPVSKNAGQRAKGGRVLHLCSGHWHSCNRYADQQHC